VTRDEVLDRARAVGLVVEPCASLTFIGIRSHKSDTNERMRMGSGGEMYTRGDDGWMYQIGTVSDVDHYVKTLEAQQ